MSAINPPEPGLELSVPTVGDVTVKYTWTIAKYARTVKKQDSLDSPAFEHNANGVRTRWNLSIRFWRGPDGRRVPNPVVVCLNLVGCQVARQSQARVRYQFGAYNAVTRAWELCHASLVALNLETTDELLSVGHTDMAVASRHESRPNGQVSLCVRLQLCPTEADEPNTLSRDLSRALGGGDVTLRCDGGRELRAHSVLLAARSPVFADMLDRSSDLDVSDVAPEVMTEVIRYVYTDRAEGLDAMAAELLPEADRFDLPGLKAACERSLVEAVTLETLPSLLMLAGRHDCPTLRRSLLAYCQDNNKSLAGLVDPDLFYEAGLGSSVSSDLDSLASDSGVAGL